jgi:hypothetical protein
MSIQDNEATIKCACIVSELTLKQRNEMPRRRDKLIVKDPPNAIPVKGSTQTIPSFNEIEDFFMLIFSKSQLESECIILALIYCERMIEETQGRSVFQHLNMRSTISIVVL